MQRVDLERSLTDSQRDEFEDMLRALTLERSQIKEAMGFALDNADAAGEVVEVLTESLTLKETPIPTKVARLMLVSDILHNSSAPVRNASAYRTKFEASLPDIMESFNDLYRNITGRITAEALKERVLKVLQAWADWFVFSDVYVNGLRATFLRPGNSGVPPFHTICGDAPPVKDIDNSEDISNSKSDGTRESQDAALAIGKGAAARELSSLPLAELERRCRHTGLSIRGGRDLMVARLLSLEEAEKQKSQDQDDSLRYGPGQSYAGKHGREINSSRSEGRWSTGNGGWKEVNHGAGREYRLESRHNVLEESVLWPQYEDHDTDNRVEATPRGAVDQSTVTLAPKLMIPQPDLKPFAKKSGRMDPVLPVPKWAREDDGSDAEDKQDPRGLGLSYSSSSEDSLSGKGKGEEQEMAVENSFPAVIDTGMNEEHRQKLRRLEVAVMEYRESLEECGKNNSEEIERKVSAHRSKLKAEFGLMDEAADNDKNNSRISESSSPDRKERWEGHRHSSSKKHSHSHSCSRSPHKSNRDRERERDKDGERDRDRVHHRHRDRDRDRNHDIQTILPETSKEEDIHQVPTPEKEEMNHTISCKALARITTPQTLKIEGHMKKKMVQEVKDHIEKEEMNPTISCNSLIEITTPKTIKIEGHIKKKNVQEVKDHIEQPQAKAANDPSSTRGDDKVSKLTDLNQILMKEITGLREEKVVLSTNVTALGLEIESTRKMTEEWKEVEKELRKELAKKDAECEAAISQIHRQLQDAEKQLNSEISAKEEECRAVNLDRKNLEATVLQLKDKIEEISADLEVTAKSAKCEKEVLLSQIIAAKKETDQITSSSQIAEDAWNLEKEKMLSRFAELEANLELMSSEKGSLSETNRELRTEAESLKAQLVSEIESARKMNEEFKKAEKELRELGKKDGDDQVAISQTLKQLQGAEERFNTEISAKEEECRAVNLDKKNLEDNVLQLKNQIQARSSELEATDKARKLEKDLLLSQIVAAKKETAEITRISQIAQETWNVEKEKMLSRLAELETNLAFMASEKGSLNETNRELKTEAESLKAQFLSEIESARKMTDEWKEAEKELREELIKKDDEYKSAISQAVKELQEAKERFNAEISMKEDECRRLNLDKKNLDATVLKLKNQIQVISSELETANEDRKLETEVFLSLDIARKETAEINRSYQMAQEDWNAEKEILLSKLAELQAKLQLVASEKGLLSETNKDLETEAEPWKAECKEIILEPGAVIETRTRQLRNRSISEYLIKWKNLPAEVSTWEDKNFTRKHQELLKR